MATKTTTELSTAELLGRRYDLAKEIGQYEEIVEGLRKQNRIHVKGSEIKWQEHALDKNMNLAIKTAPVIAPELGFPIYSMVVFKGELAPHSTPGAYHKHGEAIKYYLSGRAVEIVGDQTFEVEAGDFVLIPANVWHGTQNPYDEPVNFLAIAQLPNGMEIPTPYVRAE